MHNRNCCKWGIEKNKKRSLKKKEMYDDKNLEKCHNRNVREKFR